MSQAQITVDESALEVERTEAHNAALEGYLRETDLQQMPAAELLRWASETFPGRAVLNTSFQYTGMSMLHMAVEGGLDLRFATIDTLRLHPETYAFIEQVERRYGCTFEIVQPQGEEVERMVERFGEYLFFDSKEKQEYCCQVRKTWPNNRLLKTADCWISGQRWDQSAHRRDTARKASLVNEYGTRRRILKLNPLVDWSEQQLLGYIRENDVPVHPLYAQGYPNFGCIICATPVRPGEDRRAGRWRWFNGGTGSEGDDKKECGLHYTI